MKIILNNDRQRKLVRSKIINQNADEIGNTRSADFDHLNGDCTTNEEPIEEIKKKPNIIEEIISGKA